MANQRSFLKCEIFFLLNVFSFFVSFSIKIFIYLTKYGYYKHINQFYEYMRKGNLKKNHHDAILTITIHAF